jgi:ribonuclease HI
MSTFSSIHARFADGANRYTQNLASAAWVVYSPTDELLSSGGVYLGPATNNVAEYRAVIGLLTEAISLGVTQLIANLDSQLVVYQLNRIYSIRDPILHRLYLRVRSLERRFEFIQFQHISREFNQVADSLANYVLDWHLAHI